MPSYHTPGVYIEESLTPLSHTLSGASGTSSAAFVGLFSKGPIVPTFVSSWSQFTKIFGTFGTGRGLAPYSVYEFFNNGGQNAWIVRGMPTNAVVATVTINDRNTIALAALRVDAKAPGVYGNDINVGINDAGTSPGRFDLVIRNQGTTDANLVEKWTDLTLDPSDGRYAPNLVNSSVSGSSWVFLTDLHAADPYVVANAPALTANVALATGSDGTGAVDLAAAAMTLDPATSGAIDLNIPGVSDATVLTPVINWANNLGRIFVVADLPQSVAGNTAAQTATAFENAAAGLPASSSVATYGPWLLASDPSSLVAGSVRILPPGGAVLGQYARSDSAKGVQKAPAGVNSRLNGVLDVQTRFAASDMDTMYDAGINLVRDIPGAGLVIWGSRTLQKGSTGRYVPVRRTLIHLKEAIKANTRFAIFDENNENLWAEIRAILEQYLLTALQAGLLKGNSPSQAYYVKCDAENNPPASANAGVVNIEVGVALSSPAEFIVIKVGQFESGTLVSDNNN